LEIKPRLNYNVLIEGQCRLYLREDIVDVAFSLSIIIYPISSLDHFRQIALGRMSLYETSAYS